MGESILNELPNGNLELGEAFAIIINNMVVQNGIKNPQAENYELVSPSWSKLVKKPDKTEEEIKKIDETFKEEVMFTAESYLMFIAKISGNTSGKINYDEYENFLLKYRFGNYTVMNKPSYLNEVKENIKNAFNKISAHGESSGDNIIDKKDMAAYIYALATKSNRDENNKFIGFVITGEITPLNYAVSEKLLFENDEDNMISLKLRVAYKALFGEI